MQKRRLQAVEEAWKAFEIKKEAFVNFLTKAEERMQSVFKVLSSTKDLAIMNAEFGAFAVRERGRVRNKRKGERGRGQYFMYVLCVITTQLSVTLTKFY